MSQSKFLNRQSLYLRPDPARVVVRPFKPATEPRDLNPTDKVRANHIVDRVLRLDAEACRAAIERGAREFRRPPQEPARHFRSARRRDGGRARAPCPIEQDATRPDRRVFSQRVFVRSIGSVQSEHRPASRPDRRAGKWLPVYPEPSRRWRRAYFIADVPVRHHRRGRQRIRRSDRASRVGSKNPKPDVHAQRRRSRGESSGRTKN